MRSGKTVFLYVLAFFVPFLAALLARGFRRAVVAAILTGTGIIPGLLYALFVVRDADKGTNQAEFQTLRWTVLFGFAGLVTAGCWWIMLLVIPFLDVSRPSLEVFLPSVAPIVIGLTKPFDTLVFDQWWNHAFNGGPAQKTIAPAQERWVPQVGDSVRSLVDGRGGIVERVVAANDGRSVCVVVPHPAAPGATGVPDVDAVRVAFLAEALIRDDAVPR